MPPSQAELHDSGFGSKSTKLRLADLPASPPAPPSGGSDPPKTAMPDLGREKRESSAAPLRKIVARDLRYPEKERKVKRWNELDSDSDY